MKSFVRYIGVVDTKDRVHSVEFGPGLNVVTGKSSTGKSALIEIFDFCFGSSDFTVPEGIITSLADIYFVVLRVEKTDLVLARRREKNWAFIRAEENLDTLKDPNVLSGEYFGDEYKRSLVDYKLEIGRWFGLEITDSQEDASIREFTGRKSASPSIRSFASFTLQHQNLVANKHAVFYRFDEKEKREQVIEHFKIFLGFADQAYFLKSQELQKLQAEWKSIQIQIPKAEEVKAQAQDALNQALNEFISISGTHIDIGKLSEAVKYPLPALKKLNGVKLQVNAVSDEHVKIRRELEEQQSAITARYRTTQNRLNAISSSVRFAKDYDQNVDATRAPASVELHASRCPFCSSEHTKVEQDANELLSAIKWLNGELAKSPYRLESFEEQERITEGELSDLKQEIEVIASKISILDKQNVELEKFRTQFELALKAKLRAEAILEDLAKKPDQKLEDKLKQLDSDIRAINDYLNQNYNVRERLNRAQRKIDNIMAELGPRFEFEESYRPIKLHFAVETFDLWHDANNRKVFLRSMGSGANWLYSHLTLFLALHQYFCSLGKKCSIPSILFIDQPSQVYFPSILDNAEQFSPAELAKKQVDRKRNVDEDVKAVSNLYSQLIRYCAETLGKTGIEPQIIVTDHADNLVLDGNIAFEKFVRARWRKRGFIDQEEDVNVESTPAK